MAEDKHFPNFHLAALHVLDIWGRKGKAERIILSTMLGIDAEKLNDFPVVYYPSPGKDRMAKPVRIVPLFGRQNCLIAMPEHALWGTKEITTDIVYPERIPTLFPILNFNPSKIVEYMSDQPILDQRNLLEVYCDHSAIMENSPFIALCLNFPDSEPFADFDAAYWWRKQGDGIAYDVRAIEFELGDLSAFQTKLFDALEIQSERRTLAEKADQHVFHIPQLGNAKVKLEHLGVGIGASDGFVRDCLKALVANGIEGRVWVDAVKIERFENLIDRSMDMLWDATYTNYDLWLYMNDTVVGIPLHPTIGAYRNLNADRFQQVSWAGRFHAAYFVYLEVDGMVYDSYRASMQPIPFEEYQSQLKSTFREHFDVAAGMSLVEAWTGMYELIKQARYDLEIDLLGEYRIPTIEYGSRYVVMPSLCFAEIWLYNVGPAYILPIQDSRSEDFVRDCLEALIDCRQTFRIWIDSVPQSTLGRNIEIQVDVLREQAHREVSADEMYIPQGVYHCYIEYNDMAFDNYRAFAQPIPIAEYQNNLKSSWRRSLDVTPDMSLETVESMYDDLIQQAHNVD